MHAVVISARIESGREQEGIENLHANVLPAVKQIPGITSGYWLSPVAGQGLTVLVFETEEAANAAAAGLPNAPTPDFVTLGTPEVREVVAHV